MAPLILSHSEPGPRVVIVGAGFAGLNAAKILAREDICVTVVDRRNHHLFQPLLYQVASAALSPADISYPIRGVLSGRRNVRVLLDEVTGFDLEKRLVVCDHVHIEYDYLLVASGAKGSYFGRDEWEKHAPGLKSLADAIAIRQRILLAFERAECESDPKRREALLTFVVVGAGPTGVELAGAIGEISRQVLIDDFRAIDPRDARVILVEGGDRVLRAFPEDLSAKAERSLRDLGVWIWKNRRVSDVAADHVMIGDLHVETHNVFWAAGVSASRLGQALGAALDRGGRVVVNSDLSIPAHPEVFVAGDLANFEHGLEQALPGVAPVALQQGRHVAANIQRMIEKRAPEPFVYRDKGALATIGRASAVAQIGRVKLSGWIAWLAWLFIHIMYLVGFRNRVSVLLNWAWSYVRFSRGARLIYGNVDESG